MHGRAERSKNLLRVTQLLPITKSQPIGPRSNAIPYAGSLSPGRIAPWMLELGVVRRDWRPLIGPRRRSLGRIQAHALRWARPCHGRAVSGDPSGRDQLWSRRRDMGPSPRAMVAPALSRYRVLVW